ncbi:MAG: RNA polymerase sigma-70 factor [Bacteroidales bacterium]|nr:RNA polymerase sigma-70 factor [Bacteroidales bacterium]
MKEDQLLTHIKNNDKKAFEDIYRMYFPLLHEYAKFYIDSLQMAEDIVQDVFVKLWHSRKEISIKSTLKGYLFRSVHNRCIQYLRHNKIEQQHQVLQQAKLEEATIMNRVFFESGLSRLFESEIEALVQNALNDLPKKTREIYEFSRRQYLTNKEIAKKINLTEKSVEYHISKALESLRKCLKEFLPILIISFMNILT